MLLKLADVLYLERDFEGERSLRESIYGRLEPEEYREHGERPPLATPP